MGKVVLEKFMRSLPECKRIYVMVRPKKSISIQERLEKEVLGAEIFESLYARNPGLKEQMRGKIVAVACGTAGGTPGSGSLSATAAGAVGPPGVAGLRGAARRRHQRWPRESDCFGKSR